MFPPALTGLGASVFETTRSATGIAETVVVAVALLLVVFGSLSVVLAVAVFVITVDAGVPGTTCTTIWNVAELAGPRSAFVQEIVPLPPAGGLVHANDGPAVCVFDTKVVFAGTASISETLSAPAVPLFITVTVYVMLLPAVTGSGLSLFVTARSGPATVVDAEELLFDGFASAEVELPDAVFVIVVPTPAVAARTMENVALALALRVEMVQEIVPVPPTAGLLHANAGPLVCVSETNVVPGGSVSVSVTPCASLVPLLEIVTV